MVTYNGLVKRGQRVPETPSLWEAIMSTKTTEFSTTYFTDKFGHDYYVRVYNFETSGISAYIVEVVDMMATAANDETFYETFRDLESANAFAQDYIEKNAVPSTIEKSGEPSDAKFDNGVTYDIDSISCGIIEDAFRDAGTATIAEDYAKLTADAQVEFGENGRSELYKQMLRTKRELAAAIAKAEGLI